MNRVLVDSTNGSVDVTLASVGLGAGMSLTLPQMGKESGVIFCKRQVRKADSYSVSLSHRVSR